MLREPKKLHSVDELRKDKHTGRFRILRLEDRIAPRGPGSGGGGDCRTNPQGNKVGNCSGLE